MESKREAKRGSMTNVKEIGLPRRRHRITAIRDSPEDEEQMRLQETVRLRERQQVHKDRYRDRDRDLDSMSQTKRSRLDGYSRRSKDRDVEDGGVEDSSAEESFDEYNGEDEATAPPFYMPNHFSRRSIIPSRNLRSLPVLQVAYEMIGVAVPRRARSASVRMSNQHWNSVTGGFGEEKSSCRRLSPLTLTRRVDTVSPSSSSVPLRKKMKPLGPEIQIPKASRKPLPSVQEDIEIEVVEALFDLMKQSQSLLQSQTSKKDERDNDNNSSNPTGKLDSISNKAVGHKSKNSSMHSVQIATETSELLPEIKGIPTAVLHVGSKRKGTDYLKDEESSVAVVQEESRIGIYSFNVEPTKLESNISFSRSEKMSSGNIAQRNQELAASDEVVVPKFDVFRSSANSNADDSANSSVPNSNSTAEVIERKKEATFEIDLMAPPPMPLSPERDGLTRMVSGHKILGIDVQMKSGTLAANADSVVAAKVTVQNKQELLNQENAIGSGGVITQQSGQKKPTQCTPLTPATRRFAISNSLPFSTGATSWPGGLTHSGYMPPLQTIMPIDGSTGSSTQLQLAPFSFSQPRPKRCVTHQYIAGNIRYHQQLTKTSMGPAAGPATLCWAKRYDCSPMSSTPNSHHGKSLQEHLPGQQALAAIPVLSAESKSFEVANLKDAAKSKQLVCQQASSAGQVDNLLGPAFIFPLGQHLVTSIPANQTGATKSAATLVGLSLSNDSSDAPPVASSSFLAGATAVSFNCSNLPANEAPPFITILQNNGHPYSISANSGMSLQYKGAQAPIFPFFNASYYPSVFHISQNQPQSTSQPLSDAPHQVQQASEKAGTSASYKESKNQQEIGTRTGEHSSLNSGRMQLQQSQKQSHLSSKLDKEMSRQVIAVATSQGSCSQKTCDGQNFAIPIQTMNFAPMSCGGLGNGGNHRGKQEQHGSKYGVEVISHQTIGHPFRTSSSTLSLNFPSVSQITALPQLLPDVGRNGFQFIPTSLPTQNKNFQVADEKMITNSGGTDDGKKAILGKSVGQSLSFSKLGCGNSSASTLEEIDADGSTQTRSCLASTVTGNEPSASSTAAAAAFSINTKKSQPQKKQQELIQLQKQHIQKMQLTGTAKVEVPATKKSSYSLIGSNFSNSIPIFFQPLAHNNNFVHPSNWKNASFAATSRVPSIAANSSLINLPWQELKNAHGQHQISFGYSSNSTTNFQGQQFVINSQESSAQVDGSSSNSSPSKNTTGNGRKARPTVGALPPQQTETCSNGPSQKPTPFFGRNVPSILGTCPSQLSELKY